MAVTFIEIIELLILISIFSILDDIRNNKKK